LGESAQETILTFDDYAQKKNAFGEEMGTTGSSSFFLFGDDFYAENITFENSAGPVGQAVAMRVNGDRCHFHRCRFLGFQDTLYTYSPGSRQYYSECYIEGTVDFIFGSSIALFENCTIHSKKTGFVTAASTPENQPFGYVFSRCTLTGEANNPTHFLGRPWRPFAKTVFISCELGPHIQPTGWNNWGKESNEKTAYYAEYQNRGEGARDTSKRAPWAKQLTNEEANIYQHKTIFGDWNPIIP
jgi:pectinesterase